MTQGVGGAQRGGGLEEGRKQSGLLEAGSPLPMLFFFFSLCPFCLLKCYMGVVSSGALFVPTSSKLPAPVNSPWRVPSLASSATRLAQL